MKFVMIVPDGMADWPIKQLNNRTPLQVARTPNMDSVAAEGVVGQVLTTPTGLPNGSAVANLSLLGYDPHEAYTGRGPLEAAALGIDLAPGEIAFRCNLVTIDEHDRLRDYSAGEIPSRESAILINDIRKKAAEEVANVTFYPGISFRSLMVYRGPSRMEPVTTPPHDIMGKPFEEHLPEGAGASILRKLMLGTRRMLEEHEVNTIRVDLGENPANMIWLWGGGTAPRLESFAKRFSKKGAVIAAVDLIRGTAVYLELDLIDVEGATGSTDTNYTGKGQAAINALDEYDFVFVHIEAPDTAAHAGNIEEKVRAIEKIDREIVGPVHDALKGRSDYRLIVVPDHATPIEKKTHVSEPVPFALCGANVEGIREMPFTEGAGNESGLKFDVGYELMSYFLRA